MSKVFSGKAIILSAPSGAGKTTIVKNLIKTQMPIVFSISACSRTKRNNEKNGKDYYFLSIEEFKNNINNNSFIEWEEVYENNFYGTLKTEIIRIWESNNHVIFDVDVIGGIALKKYFNEKALSIFIDPPSTEVLFERLRKRDTDDSHSLKRRMEKAESELSYKNQFDQIITNDKLEIAIKQTTELVQNFISR
jgi:guanylate kinase